MPKNVSRVVFPESGFTLGDCIDYYEGVAPVLLPHLRARPVSLKRYPETIDDESFWVKDAPAFTPRWVRTADVPRRSGGVIRYIVIDNLRTLRWAVEIGGIEIHPFLHETKDIRRPTHVVFDLDPGAGAGVLECGEVAVLMRERLQRFSLESIVKTSGSKGLQLYVPLRPRATHEVTETFARVVAEELARDFPTLITARMKKELRRRKIFIDWSQNADFKTTVAVYSLRAKRSTPFVSTPLRWDELTRWIRKGEAARFDFTPAEVLRRIRRSGDLFAALERGKQSLPSQFLRVLSDATPRKKKRDESEEGGRTFVYGSVTLPKPRTQSGRRLFVLPRTETGDELWLDVAGMFQRFILRKDREGKKALVAMPAGEFPVDESYFRGKVQEAYRDKVEIQDLGAYERLEGSFERERIVLSFEGSILQGEWTLEKIQKGSKRHRSWRLAPQT